MKEYNLYVMNTDNCPAGYGDIIYKGLCKGCDYNKGFDMYNGQPCIKCSFASTDKGTSEDGEYHA